MCTQVPSGSPSRLFVVTAFYSTIPFFPNIVFVQHTLLSNLCPCSPLPPGLPQDLISEPVHGYCHGHGSGLFHIHNAAMIHVTTTSRLSSWPCHGSLCVPSYVLLHGPAHFPRCGALQGPVLCPGPDKCINAWRTTKLLLKEEKNIISPMVQWLTVDLLTY